MKGNPYRSAYQAGISLLELMIAVAIVGILAGIALPAYSDYVLRGKRAEGKAFLSEYAAREERFYSDNNQYTETFDGVTSENGYYTLNVSPDGTVDQTFVLTATPTGFADNACGNLTLDNTGARGSSISDPPPEICWGR
jgi:type IV pilus assembly protein PilE